MTKKRIHQGEPSFDHEELKILAQQLGRPVNTLIALSPQNDPFYIGPARQQGAQWFARLWRDFLSGKDVHVRRLHYRLVSQEPPIIKVSGTPFQNTDPDWNLLVEAARDARYANLVPADQFVDRRADEPLIRLDAGSDAECTVSVDNEEAWLAGRAMPSLPTLTYEFAKPRIAQRYHLELWCEKTTINDVLERLADRYRVNVITGSGELSVTACLNVIDRALASGRRWVRILYVSDFDPGGESMPVAVARKIEFLLYQRGLKDALDIQVRPVALTYDQCQQYHLPRTPIKDTERRAARFEQRYGEGATELDALEALHPGELERILKREIVRYYDDTLNDRVDEIAEQAEDELRDEIERVNQEVLTEHRADIDRLRKRWAKISKEIAAWMRDAKPVWQAITEDLTAQAPEPPEVDWPEPDEGDEDPDALFDSTRDYVAQIDRYKRHQGKPTVGHQIETICGNCGNPFLAQRSTARACSPQCRKMLYRAELRLKGGAPAATLKPPAKQMTIFRRQRAERRK